MSEIDFKPCETALASQRAALLAHLKEHGSITTIFARDSLGIAHPAGRLLELRKAGHTILTVRCVDYDLFGRRHSCASYSLVLTGDAA